MKRLLFYLLFVCLVGCSVSKDPRRKEVLQLQKGKVADDSSYVYWLPFESGKKHLIVQGYYGNYSHKNRIALDIKMKKGTKVCAARDGVVIRVVEHNNRGGWSRKNRPYANLIVLQHDDGTRTGYWHLLQNGALVNVGDSVKQGQVIGLSGKTGYSAMPHLHFMVWRFTDSGWTQVPTRFLTSKGIKFLRPMHCYRSKHE